MTDDQAASSLPLSNDSMPRVQGRDTLGPDSTGLPPANTTRWVIRRKALVVAGVRDGVISLEEACNRYNLSVEEFQTWQRQIERYGLPGLRATRLQDYRLAPDGETPR
jgi:hypothetical protein